MPAQGGVREPGGAPARAHARRGRGELRHGGTRRSAPANPAVPGGSECAATRRRPAGATGLRHRRRGGGSGAGSGMGAGGGTRFATRADAGDGLGTTEATEAGTATKTEAADRGIAGVRDSGDASPGTRFRPWAALSCRLVPPPGTTRIRHVGTYPGPSSQAGFVARGVRREGDPGPPARAAARAVGSASRALVARLSIGTGMGVDAGGPA